MRMSAGREDTRQSAKVLEMFVDMDGRHVRVQM